MVGALHCPSQEQFRAELETHHNLFNFDFTAYKNVFVMPSSDKNLDTIIRQERPSMNYICIIMFELCRCLQHLHDEGILHGDIKAANVVRVAGHIRLIDLDAACRFTRGICDCDFAGSKFSSGSLPPEMFAMLSEEKKVVYETYWTKCKCFDADLSSKLTPKRVISKSGVANYLVVRTFDTELSKSESSSCANSQQSSPTCIPNSLQSQEDIGEISIRPRDKDSLPYSLVRAGVALDMWSTGVLFYYMCTGDPLLSVNRDDDFSSAEAMHTAATWTDVKLHRIIMDKVGNSHPLAADLLRTMLRCCPSDRPKSMDEVLKHPFFGMGADSGGGGVMGMDISRKLDAVLRSQEEERKILEEIQERARQIDERTQAIERRTIVIEQMSERTFLQLRRTERVLLRGMFEATEVR